MNRRSKYGGHELRLPVTIKFRAELAALICAKQSVPELPLFQNRPTQQIACPLLQTRGVLAKGDRPDIVKATNVEQRHEVGARKSVFVRQSHIQRRIRARPLHVGCAQ